LDINAVQSMLVQCVQTEASYLGGSPSIVGWALCFSGGESTLT